MADLDTLTAAQTVKIAGANSSGVESSFVNSTDNNELKTSDIIDIGGIEGALTVGTSAVEVKVGVSKYPGRKCLTLFNNSNTIIYWGYTSSVTTLTGTPIFKNSKEIWSISDNVSIYVIANSVGNDVRVTEAG